MKEITAENFEPEVLQSEKPVVIDFWAEWCNPCRMFAPEFEACAEALGDAAKFVKLNVDANPELTRKYRVMSIPTLMIVKNGEPVAKHVGAVSQDELTAMVKEIL